MVALLEAAYWSTGQDVSAPIGQLPFRCGWLDSIALRRQHVPKPSHRATLANERCGAIYLDDGEPGRAAAMVSPSVV
jgi:hypothetical protein